MTGLILGLLAGAGLVLVLAAASHDGPALPRRPRVGRLASLLRRAGAHRVTPGVLVIASCGLGLVTGVLALAITSVPVIGLVAMVAGACLPVMLLRRAALRRTDVVRAAWPDAVDALTSGVRAGLSLGEALTALATRGPLPLQSAFSAFTADLRASGSLESALDALQSRLADPVADRVIAALRIARDAGGSDLGRVLRDLSALLRDEARARGEIQARQSWTVSSARVAVAAPWVTLVLLCTRAQAAAAYRSPQGLVLILVAAVVTVAAYRVMLRIARLPVDTRFLA